MNSPKYEHVTECFYYSMIRSFGYGGHVLALCQFLCDSVINAEPNKSIQEIARALTGSLISVKVHYHVAIF